VATGTGFQTSIPYITYIYIY